MTFVVTNVQLFNCCNEYCLNENKKIEASNICWNE